MPGLSRLARHGLMWAGLAIGMWATGDRWARRAVWRGIGGAAAAGAAASLARGLANAQTDIRLLSPSQRQPTRRATPLPSAQAALAAAFATGAALEHPRLAAPVVVLAAAVGASQVAAGAEDPSDVLAGFVVGAAAGAATLRWWPRRPPVPAAAVRPPRAAPAAYAGEGLVLVINTSAGTASAGLTQRLRAELPQAVLVKTDASQDVTGQLRRAAGQARILGVAGGDGTVRAACAVALDAGLPLLVIPAGTFNHFAADLGVWSADDAVAALRAGEAVLVDVGVAGHRTFINTSSTGVYVDLVRAREQMEGVLGRRAAVIISLIQVLRAGRPHELILNGRHRRLWLYFAGNCQYEPVGTAPAYRPNLSDGYLDVRVVDAGRLARTRLVAAVLTGTLGRSRVYHAWRTTAMDISSADGTPVWLSVDGEVATAEAGFRQGKRPQGLLVYRRVGSVSRGMPAVAPRWLRRRDVGVTA
jgi:diacylglycerol kinase family enzyme